MDRRQFVVGTAASAGVLSFAACGGGADAGTTPTSVATSSAPVLTVAGSSGPLAQIPQRGVAQFQSWDGGSGPSRDYWSRKLQLPWKHGGQGDWLDASQLQQGPAPYAVGSVSMGPLSLDVTRLVDRWVQSGTNRGFYIRSDQNWAFAFSGRTNALASARPQLIIVSNTGTTMIGCSCNANWSPSSFQGEDSRDTFQVAKDNHFAALQFDTSAISGPVQRATLSLTCLSLKYPGMLEIFELDPPEFRDGGGSLTARSGIASNYIFDRNLATDPRVIFASDFADLSKSQWQTGTVVPNTGQVKDPRTKSTYLRGLIPKGGLGGCGLERSVINGTTLGTPTAVETELYARYYVFLEDDWGSEIDANKMPGWDGRFGWWNSMGYWQSTTGNGGARPTGLKVRNSTASRWEYEGASMRGHGGTRSNDGNPYDDLFWIGSYIYHLDQVGAFGEPVKWTGVVIGKGRWYCIEQYIKMNSIVGPFDAVGNGTAVHDGEYKVWVDGVPAYERTNFRWRRHPEMGIQGFWLNWYHGGTAPAPRDMHFRMDSMVIAKDYIGPRNERL